MKKLQLKKVLLVKGGESSRMSFFRGLRSEWMKSGHGGRGGQKRPKMGGRPLYTVPRHFETVRLVFQSSFL